MRITTSNQFTDSGEHPNLFGRSTLPMGNGDVVRRYSCFPFEGAVGYKAAADPWDVSLGGILAANLAHEAPHRLESKPMTNANLCFGSRAFD